jgi:AcrR family transcriptional regulator
MVAKKANESLDTNTEAKIKAAARIVFHKKGYSATRTRDIADEAKINLALLNYYFRSKEKLFELIVFETLTSFYQNMGSVFNDETTSLEKKIALVAEKYIDLISMEPEIPLFLMSEIRRDPERILVKLPVVLSISKSVFIRQYKEAAQKGKITEPNPLHFLMNIMGMVVFPFMNRPIIQQVGNIGDKQFNQLMQDRKKLIPIWVKAMLKAK